MITIPQFLKPSFWQRSPASRKNRLTAKCNEIETMFWNAAYEKMSRLGTFTPQVEVGYYRLDFALTAIRGARLLKIAIEIDGQDWHSSPEQRDHDYKRDRYLSKEAWQVIRFTGSQVYRNVDACVDETIELVKTYQRYWGKR